MKKKFIYFVIFIGIFPLALSAHERATNDSINIDKVFRYIENNTVYKIFSTVDTTLKISFNGNDIAPGPALLKTILSDTKYNISVFRNYIFVTEDKELILDFSASLIRNKKDEKKLSGNLSDIKAIEKLTSENKLYVVGNPYTGNVSGKVTISGKVTDFKSGEPLAGVNLTVNERNAATTDKDGEFTIELPSGRIQLDIAGFGIKDSRRHLMLYESGRLLIELEEEPFLLGEITVFSGRIENVKNTQIGFEKIQMGSLKNIPMALGEVDLLKAIQTLPGVKTVGEASSGFNVRGGATDQNLILLNDGTIYNPNHLFGFFTAFNSDMIKEAEIYKSSIPAKYGGRISSVLDISLKEANKEKFTGSAGIGLVTSKLNLEIPIIKKRTSLLLSGRTTYSDWILKQLPEKSGYNDGKAGFYDLGAVFSHKFNSNNNLNISGYYSHDKFSFSVGDEYIYNNMNSSAKFRTVFTDKLIGYFTVGYDHYDYQNEQITNAASAFRLSFDINQLFFKSDFAYDLNDKHKIDFGFKSMLYSINSGTYEPVGNESLVVTDKLQKDKALESAIYVGDQWEINEKFSVNAGIRYSMFSALGPKTYNLYQPGLLPEETNITGTEKIGSGQVIKTYHGPELRLSMRYAFSDNMSVKAGFNSMKQYIHKLSNTSIMSPTDTWKLSDKNIKPQNGWQAASGLYYSSPGSAWELSLEGYYKKMTDYLDYKSGAKILMNHHIETDVIATNGHSYGLEILIKKAKGKFNGWLGYTYSRTFLKQNDPRIDNPVNKGKWYPTEYDKPHEVNFVGNYKFTRRYSISINMDYSTGRPTTVPAGKYWDKELNTNLVYYTDRNSYRIPDYFRTDISFNIEPSHKLTLLTHSSISIGVYNVTGRKNLYSIYYVSEGNDIKGYKLSIFGVPIPFITYNIRF